MRNLLLLGTAAAAVLAFGADRAVANTVMGTVYEVTQAQASDATPATVAGLPASDPFITFTEPSSPLNNVSGGLYTIGEFLASGGATGITLHNGALLSDTLDGTLFNFVGTVTVANGDMFTAGHDDGLTLTIGTTTVISVPGPTSFVLTTKTYTGPGGNLPFQLVYGECCGAPAQLSISLPLVSTPEPATAALLGVGLLGLGLVRRRKSA